VNWACADNSQGNILGNNCTNYPNAPSGSPDTKRCESVVNIVVQQKIGVKGLTIYVKDGLIKSNFDVTGTTQCGWPGGCAGTYPSGVSDMLFFLMLLYSSMTSGAVASTRSVAAVCEPRLSSLDDECHEELRAFSAPCLNAASAAQ
jgi:hypothetical protein